MGKVIFEPINFHLCYFFLLRHVTPQQEQELPQDHVEYLRLALGDTEKVHVVDVDLDGLVLQVRPRDAQRELAEVA